MPISELLILIRSSEPYNTSSDYFVTYEGVVKYIQMLQEKDASATAQKWAEQFAKTTVCPECKEMCIRDSCEYEDGERRYILAPVGLAAGDSVLSSAAADIKPGNCLPLANIPVGTVIHNIELYPGKGAQLVRSAGVAAQLMAKEGDMATVRLPSGEYRKVRMNCKATIGQVGNIDHSNISIGKAGSKRHMGIRPPVRGSVIDVYKRQL